MGHFALSRANGRHLQAFASVQVSQSTPVNVDQFDLTSIIVNQY
jgi:hypothetical protein